MQIKKLLAPVVLPLTITTLFGLAACGGDSSDNSNPADPSGQVTPADTSNQSNPVNPTDTTNQGNQTNPQNPVVSSSSQASVPPPTSSAEANPPPTSSAAQQGTNPTPSGNVALATKANAARPLELYKSWKSFHFVTLEDEIAYYPALEKKSSYVFTDEFKPAGRVIWQNSTIDKCKDKSVSKASMRSRLCTVSEGTGYGMLLTYFNGDEDAYIRLWNYSRAYRDYNSSSTVNVYLTPWITNSFDYTDIDNSSATDADLDIATSLVLMYYKTSNKAYLDDALNIIGAIWDHEVNKTTFLLYSGDTHMWTGDNPIYNMSYFSPVALRLFAKVDTEHEWSKVLEAMYAYMKKVQDAGTGVFPDWSDGQGVAADPENGSAASTYWTFNKEAVRVPWRIAWDYYWFQDERDLAVLTKLNKFISDKASGDPSSMALAVNYSWDPNKKDANVNGDVVSPQWLSAWCATGIGTNADWLNKCTELVNAKSMTNNSNSYFPDILLGLYSTLLNGKFVKPAM